MTSEAIKQDFESALVKHLAFKARLRSFLYGNNNAEGPLRDPEQCVLGRWIIDRRHGAYRQAPAMADLDAAHRHIHQQANHVMDRFQAGHQAEAQAGFAEVQRTADHIVELLRTIEAQVRKAGIEQITT